MLTKEEQEILINELTSTSAKVAELQPLVVRQRVLIDATMGVIGAYFCGEKPSEILLNNLPDAYTTIVDNTPRYIMDDVDAFIEEACKEAREESL